ncbi:hypothetical protein [Prevotella sp. E2-28]|uniref:hypothetical protein n=1 Tax=Prevotella sp. E2-28 TaxID=2913620 RepID=UPI001EDB4CA9|nr:hypothetical protein [Prevotella sp. E2-28]UKK52635.1 hypothetical protein L6465_08455 [Prevotella sp. E2-28]
MKEEKKMESELLKKVDNFTKEIESVFTDDEKQHKAVLLIAIDEDVDAENCIIQGVMRGKRSVLCRGIAGVMKENKDVSNVLEEGVDFYHFTQNPLKTIKRLF